MKKLTTFLALTLAVSACTKKETNTQYVAGDQAIAEHYKTTAQEPDPELKQKMEGVGIEKRQQKTVFRRNEALLVDGKLGDAMNGHTELYKFTGTYRVMVIPVQFSDAKMVDAEFFSTRAQEYIFGDNANSMTSYYKHASMGQFNLKGEVTPIITVDGTLASYGEAVTNNNDKNARGLVVDALEKLKESRTDKDWWAQYDSWDVNDYDNDGNYHEPDGFVDAVVLIYAGKSQASCQRSFDPDGKKPGSADVPEGPRRAATVECFNRIWPHRWAISLPQTDPRYVERGPEVEGRQRPSMNGLKINDELFALDYNMQSEFSDLSTFMHEFGHSLTLPDVYSSGDDNSTGAWELMSQNANLQAQEFSTYSKLALGWLAPKVVKQGENTSAYLGSYSYVSTAQRVEGASYGGPVANQDGTSILSNVPEFGEDVYRSVVVLTEPTHEAKEVVALPATAGTYSAYSGRFDGNSRSVKLKLNVPAEGDAKLSFDTIFHIETETNFDSSDAEIKVVTDFDLGSVLVNGKTVDTLRTISGDVNADSLAELNADCEVAEVLRLRTKKINGGLTDDEKTEFNRKAQLCQKPIWTNKSYDLAEFKGQEIEFEVRYVTDAGYTEFGIVVDNVKLGDQTFDFENGHAPQGGFVSLKDGKEDLTFNQFYLMEYRTPGEKYVQDGQELSYNMDNNIEEGTQSFFQEGDAPLPERFRMVTYDYRPGLLVWYFNSKYDRRSNNAAGQGGKGYLLVVNSKVQEVKLPGSIGDARFFDANGHYRDEKEDKEFKDYLKVERDLFACYAYFQYASYINGEAPVCDDSVKDHLQGVTFEGKQLRYRRERFNEFLPYQQYNTVAVDQTYRNYAGMRTGLSTFNPPQAGEFSPFKVYREEEGKMVLDAELTESAAKFAPVSSFKDKDNVHSAFKRFQGDSVVVEKKGLEFKVDSPSSRVLSQYVRNADGDDNDNWFRRPRVKVYFDWVKAN